MNRLSLGVIRFQHLRLAFGIYHGPKKMDTFALNLHFGKAKVRPASGGFAP